MNQLEFSSGNLTELWFDEINYLAYYILSRDPKVSFDALRTFRDFKIDPNAYVKTLNMLGALKYLRDAIYKAYQKRFNDDFLLMNLKNLNSVIDRSAPIVYGMPYYG